MQESTYYSVNLKLLVIAYLIFGVDRSTASRDSTRGSVPSWSSVDQAYSKRRFGYPGDFTSGGHRFCEFSTSWCLRDANFIRCQAAITHESSSAVDRDDQHLHSTGK